MLQSISEIDGMKWTAVYPSFEFAEKVAFVIEK